MQENQEQKFKGILINKIPPVDPNDTRGLTYEWCKGLPGLQVSIYTRNPSIVCGNHYHMGYDPSKNPERFFLIEGKATLVARNPENQVLEEIVEDGTELLIYPNILHKLQPITKVYFVEYRSTPFDKENSDTYPSETYDYYISSLNPSPSQLQPHSLH